MAARFCARCGKDLTDAASMECGTGPTCRLMDNALYATLIPSDVRKACHRLMEVNPEEVAELARPTFDKVVEALYDPTAVDCKDWRLTVKRIEWMLSFPCKCKDALIDVVKCLGYVGLASLLNGEAATGKASVLYLNGRIYLYGPRNKAGREALKAIPGRRFHPKEESTDGRASWSVPFTGWKAFKLTVLSHWPNVDHAELETVCETAELAVLKMETAKALTLTETPVPTVSTMVSTLNGSANLPKNVSVTEVNGTLKVRTPWNGGFIADLKGKVPYAGRKWNPVEKVWEVSTVYRPLLETLLKHHYATA